MDWGCSYTPPTHGAGGCRRKRRVPAGRCSTFPERANQFGAMPVCKDECQDVHGLALPQLLFNEDGSLRTTFSDEDLDLVQRDAKLLMLSLGEAASVLLGPGANNREGERELPAGQEAVRAELEVGRRAARPGGVLGGARTERPWRSSADRWILALLTAIVYAKRVPHAPTRAVCNHVA